MIVKIGRFNYWCDDKGNKITLLINKWESPFGLEQYLKKHIINFKIPTNNEGYNLESIIAQIQQEIMTSFKQDVNSPIKNRGENFLRVEVSNITEKNVSDIKPLILSGELEFKIYQWKGIWGISVNFNIE